MMYKKMRGVNLYFIALIAVIGFSMGACGDNPGGNGVAPAIITTALPAGTAGTEYRQTLAATGDKPITWGLVGVLPDGLNLDGETGVIAGTPTTEGTSSFTVKATNAAGTDTKPLSIIITTTDTRPTIITETLPDGTVGTEYSQTLEATGDTPITWSVENEDESPLPEGLSLDEETGVIAGEPTTAGISTFTVKATNEAGTGTKSLSIIITTTDGRPTIITAMLPDGTVGTEYSQTLAATGDTPITWSVENEDESPLPEGLSLDGETGVISGTPTTAGTSTFTVKATNEAGTDTKSLSIIITTTDTRPTIITASLPGGTAGTAYSQELAATGETPITWSVENEAESPLPAGLGLSETGVISGTPTTAGTSTFTVKATNAAGTDTKSLSIIITTTDTHPAITTVALENGRVGTAYNQRLTATGTAPITWSIENEAESPLPDGLSLSETGVIAGEPTTAGTSSFTVKATNAVGNDTKSLSIIITSSDGSPTIITTSLPVGAVGIAYSQTLTAVGDAPITWSLDGLLPAGLSLSGTGVIAGTPTTTGTSTFSVRATNAVGISTKQFSITIAVAPIITTTSLPVGTAGAPYNLLLTATGTKPVTWSIDSGVLPTGLSLVEGTGFISGMPTTGGIFTFTVKATNAAGNDTNSLSITIVAAPTITTTSLPGGTVGTPYNLTLAATGTTPITWIIEGIENGALPAGLSLDKDTGVIAGTPTTGGTSTFTVKAFNTIGSGIRQFSITIAVAPTITTEALPDGLMGEAYNSQTLAATGDMPITWSLESGALPPGLSFDAGTGVIAGTPTTGGTFTFTIRATNAAGVGSKQFSITINAAPTITTTSLPDAAVGKEYNQTLAATGTMPITWSLESGALSAGLSFDAETGVIAGTPTTGGTTTFTVKATNVIGFDIKSLSITIAVAPTITTTSLSNGVVGRLYEETLEASGATSIWTIRGGALPAGLSLSETGVIAGTPTTKGTFTFTVRATNAAYFHSRQFSITINVAPTITTTSPLDNGKVGTPYIQTLAATGDTPITWSLENGSLPAGLILAPTTGVISGTPTTTAEETETSTFTVKATNDFGNDTKELSITIAVAPTITTTSLANGIAGRSYSQTLTAMGTTPITWSLVGLLPAGLSLAETGVISGTPTTEGTSTFTVEAVNDVGNATKQLSITINVLPTITTEALPKGTEKIVYSQTLAATGTTPITWEIISGDLPTGLSLVTTTGVISGMPTTTATEPSTFTVRATNMAGNVTKELSITIEPLMVVIPAGTFMMGSPDGTGGTVVEPDRNANETQHEVTLTQGFYMGKYQVTQAQYQAVMGNNPSAGSSDPAPGEVQANRPVEMVSWYSALVFCNKLSMLEDLTPVYRINGSTDPAAWGSVPTVNNATWNAAQIVLGSNGYHLPTEAQWEYACRAGTITAYNTGATISDDTGWSWDNSGGKTHEVGLKSPNDWCLYDMHGNLWEWCWDWFGSYSAEAQTDPTGPPNGTMRGRRGGAFGADPVRSRSAYRNYIAPERDNPDIGFRVVRPLVGQTIQTDMILIRKGTFQMGSPSGETGRQANETQHSVTLTQGFYMGKYPVTQAQYEAVMGNNPSTHKVGGTLQGDLDGITNTANFPVDQVTWYEALVFCNKLSMLEGLSPAYRINGSTNPTAWGSVPTSSNDTWNAVQIVADSKGYRLPTEAQWEYACRAGTTTAYNTGSDAISDSTGWYNANSGNRTHSVGEKPANRWGLYDMHGNVIEHCWDFYDDNYGGTAGAAVTDPTGPASGGNRTRRGGSYSNPAAAVRSAYRGSMIPPSSLSYNNGFRLVRPANEE